MLRTLDALLFYLLQIINKRQEVDRACEQYIKNPNELGITNIHEKVHSFFAKQDHYNLSNEEQYTFGEPHKAFLLIIANSITNIENEKQKEAILKLSNILIKASPEDEQLQSSIKDLHYIIDNNHYINLDEINQKLMTIIDSRIYFNESLQLDIIEFLVENFEVLLNNKVDYKTDFIQFSHDDEGVSPVMIKKEIDERIIQLKSLLTKLGERKIDMIKEPFHQVKSFVMRIGSQKKANKLWSDIINEKEIAIRACSMTL